MKGKENLNTVTIFVKNKNIEKEFIVEKGIRINDAFKEIIDNTDNRYLACIYNNKLKSFGHRTMEDGEITFLDPSSDTGEEIYIRGLMYILSKAVYDINKNDDLRINYHLDNSMFCEIAGQDEVSEDWLDKVNKRMKEIVEQDLLIKPIKLTRDEAEEFYKKHDTYRGRMQLEKESNSYVKLYFCEDYFNYFFGIMPVSTGSMSMFELRKYDRGFLILYPKRDDFTIIPAFKDNKKLHYTLSEFDDIYEALGVDTLTALNERIRLDQKDVILLSEALHERKIAELGKKIKKHKDCKMILIAGPSCSGKTTFAAKLSYALRLFGLKPITISVDNYFVERDETPKDEFGNYDFETIDALDTKLFNEHLEKLINGEEVLMPTFDFKTGNKKYLGNKLKLEKDEILIIEGIHCLNDKLTESIDRKYKFKVYISALTVLNIDYSNRISTSDTRLIRRILRDHHTRHYSARQTIKNWYSVRRGERKYIFPYQEDADFMFNSAVIYELGSIKRQVLPLLKEIDEDSPAYSEAKRLITLLEYAQAVDPAYIPNNSIIREFIGGSIYDDDYKEQIRREHKISVLETIQDLIKKEYDKRSNFD